MKWPRSLTFIRHDTSAYNLLRPQKLADPVYQAFLEEWRQNPDSEECLKLALQVKEKFALGVGDADTPLADAEGRQAFETGVGLRENGADLPDVIFVSPYTRALKTLEHITRGWPELAKVKTYEDERIREQEHGLALIYNDWRVFETIHPEQRELRAIEGSYWYRYPQGENVPDVRNRNRLWQQTVMRDFAEKHVLAVTHHLNILALRANLERLSAKEFIHLDEHEKPINCGVTRYVGRPDLGTDGKLVLDYYNHQYYTSVA